MLPRLLLVVGLTVGVMLPLIWAAFAPVANFRAVSEPDADPAYSGSPGADWRGAPPEVAEPSTSTARSNETTIGTAPHNEGEASAARSDDLPRARLSEPTPIKPKLPEAYDKEAAPEPLVSEAAKAPPEEAKALPEEAKALPEEAKALPEEAKALPEEAKALPQESKALPEEAKALPEEAKALPEEAKALPEESKALPEEAKALPEEAKALPAEAKALPEEAKALPEEAKALPAEAKALPGEAKALPEGAKAPPEEAKALPEEARALPEEPKALPAEAKAPPVSEEVASATRSNDLPRVSLSEPPLIKPSFPQVYDKEAVPEPLLSEEAKPLPTEAKPLFEEAKPLLKEAKPPPEEAKALSQVARAPPEDATTPTRNIEKLPEVKERHSAPDASPNSRSRARANGTERQKIYRKKQRDRSGWIDIMREAGWLAPGRRWY